jgi:hypothetical protein
MIYHMMYIYIYIVHYISYIIHTSYILYRVLYIVYCITYVTDVLEFAKRLSRRSGGGYSLLQETQDVSRNISRPPQTSMDLYKFIYKNKNIRNIVFRDCVMFGPRTKHGVRPTVHPTTITATAATTTCRFPKCWIPKCEMINTLCLGTEIVSTMVAICCNVDALAIQANIVHIFLIAMSMLWQFRQLLYIRVTMICLIAMSMLWQFRQVLYILF